MVRIKHSDRTYNVKLAIYDYRDSGRLAVFLERGAETYWCLSVNIPEVALATDEFIAKTYSENEGVLDQLADAGLVEYVRGVATSDMGFWPVYRLLKRRGS
jgi:hypothetical protein